MKTGSYSKEGNIEHLECVGQLVCADGKEAEGIIGGEICYQKVPLEL